MDEAMYPDENGFDLSAQVLHMAAQREEKTKLREVNATGCGANKCASETMETGRNGRT